MLAIAASDSEGNQSSEYVDDALLKMQGRRGNLDACGVRHKFGVGDVSKTHLARVEQQREYQEQQDIAVMASDASACVFPQRSTPRPLTVKMGPSSLVMHISPNTNDKSKVVLARGASASMVRNAKGMAIATRTAASGCSSPPMVQTAIGAELKKKSPSASGVPISLNAYLRMYHHTVSTMTPVMQIAPRMRSVDQIHSQDAP